jgi:hypothetical protein
MWETLMKEGYKDENIFVLFADGVDFPIISGNQWVADRYRPTNLIIDPPITSITDYAATRANIYQVFSELQGKSTADDFLFVWTHDHGVAFDENGNVVDGEFIFEVDHVGLNLALNNEYLYDYDLKAWTENIQANKKVFQMGQCYSGGFIDDLEGNNIMINTACGGNFANFAKLADDKYKGSTEITGLENEIIDGITYGHSEFYYHILSALNGEAPDGLTTYPQIIN